MENKCVIDICKTELKECQKFHNEKFHFLRTTYYCLNCFHKNEIFFQDADKMKVECHLKTCLGLNKNIKEDEEDSLTGDEEDSLTGDEEDSLTGDEEDSLTGDEEDSLTGDEEDSLTGDEEDQDKSDKINSLVGMFNYDLTSNPILFGNKCCSLIKLNFPIASVLNKRLKGQLKEQIRETYLKMKKMVNNKKKKKQIIYFRFNKMVLFQALLKLEKNQILDDASCLIALRYGYLGETVSPKNRSISHYPSDNEVIIIKFKTPDINNSNKAIESIIIKLINIKNMINNKRSGSKYIFKNLNNNEHLFIGLHYLFKSFDKLREHLVNNPLVYHIPELDEKCDIQSQDTVINFANNFEFDTIDTSNLIEYNPIKINNINYNDEISKFNVAGVCTANPRCNQYGTSFKISDGEKEISIFFENDQDKLIFNLIKKGNKYLVINGQLKYSYHHFIIQINENQNIKLIRNDNCDNNDVVDKYNQIQIPNIEYDQIQNLELTSIEEVKNDEHHIFNLIGKFKNIRRESAPDINHFNRAFFYDEINEISIRIPAIFEINQNSNYILRNFERVVYRSGNVRNKTRIEINRIDQIQRIINYTKNQNDEYLNDENQNDNIENKRPDYITKQDKNSLKRKDKSNLTTTPEAKKQKLGEDNYFIQVDDVNGNLLFDCNLQEDISCKVLYNKFKEDMIEKNLMEPNKNILSFDLYFNDKLIPLNRSATPKNLNMKKNTVNVVIYK